MAAISVGPAASQARIISVHGAGTTNQPTAKRMLNIPGAWGGKSYYG